MMYGLKYISSFDSEGNNYLYEIKIYERDYSGSTYKRSLGGAPVLRKDSAESVCGTSLEFLLETTFDGDLREFYTEDNKKFKVELYRDGKLYWVGFVVTEVYNEEMSYLSDVSIQAADGLGLLKNEEYLLSGEKYAYEIVKYCVDKTGLVLGYEVHHAILRTTDYRSFWNCAKMRAEIFQDRKNCYEVLSDLLKGTGYYITQAGCRWVLQTYLLAFNGRIYNSDFVELEDSRSVSYKICTAYSLAPLFPVGAMAMSVEPSRKEITVIQDYLTYPSFFGNWNFSSGDCWEGDGEYATLDDINCIWIRGVQKEFTKKITQSVLLERTVRVGFYLEIKYAVSAPASASSEYYIAVNLRQGDYQMTENGWVQLPGKTQNLLLKVDKLSTSAKTEWNTFKIYAVGLPTDGELTIELSNVKGAVDSNEEGLGVCYSEVCAMFEIPAEARQTFSLAPGSSKTEEIKLPFGDTYDIVNTAKVTGNALLVDGVPTTGSWEVPDASVIIHGGFRHVVGMLYANLYCKPRLRYSGTLYLEGRHPDFNFESYFRYQDSKNYYLVESGEYNLLTDEVTVELLERVNITSNSFAGKNIAAARSVNTAGTIFRASGNSEYRTYQAKSTEVASKMIRDLDPCDIEKVTDGALFEIDIPGLPKSQKISNAELKKVLHGNWFYEKDGRLYCKLDLIGEKGVSAYGLGPDGSSSGGWDLIDELTSTRTDVGLTANMGRYLKTLIDGKASSWDTITGKPDVFPSAAHSHSYLPLTGGTLSGDLTAKTITANGYLQGISNTHTVQIGSQNTGYCHYNTTAEKHFFNHPVYVLGDVYAGASYNRRLAYVDELTNAVLYGEVGIDATGLDQNKWYPVTVDLGSHDQVEIRVIVSLQWNTPSWATHAAGFSCRFVEVVNGCGWGTNYVNRRILCNDCKFASVNPVGGVTQNDMANMEIIYVRGGGYYYFHVSTGAIPTLHASGYNWVNGTYSYSAPVRDSILNDNWQWEGTSDLINRANKLNTARTLWGQPFDGTGNVSGHLSDVDGLTSVGTEATYTTISGQIGSPVHGVIAKYSVQWYNERWEWLYYRGGSADIQNIVLALNGTQKYRFDRAGNFLATGEITAYSASDRRLKENIKNITGRASNFLRKLNPVEFDWNDTAMKLNPAKHRHDYSFLADEYGEVFPFAVSTIYEKYQSIDTKILLPLLVAGFKELDKRLNNLEQVK